MNADGLSRIAMSSGLAASLSRATEYARAQGHSEVALEHMLLALCDDPDAALVLAASNINVAELTAEIGRNLSLLPTRPQGQEGELLVAADMRRILEAAAAAARGGRRREINGAIVLAAIIGDGKSVAAQVLSGLGLTFEGAIRALQSKPAAPAPEPSTARPLPPTDAESILAGARERVQSRTVTAPPRRQPPPAEPVREEPRFDEPASPPAPLPDAERTAPDPQPAPAPAAPKVQPAPPAPVAHPREPVTQPQPPARPSFHTAPEPPFEPRPPAFELPPSQRPPQAPTFDDYEPGDYDSAGGYAAEEYEAAAYPPEPAPVPSEPDYDFGPPPMPASPPFPPPIPAPSPHEGWAPPPSPPPAPSRPGAPPMPAARPPMPPPAPGASGARPGPPPLAPWPEPERQMGAPQGYDMGRHVPQPPMARGPSRQGTPRAEIGQLVENIPRSMRVAVPALIEVRVARSDVRALAEGLQGGGAAYQHEVTVTKAMSVRLRAPDGGFFIETVSPETQWIERSMQLSEEDFASWRWHVTPRETGRKRLQLIISARTVSADGLAAETALPDQVITVRVRTNYAQSATRWIGWGVAAVAGGLLAKFGEGAVALLSRMLHS